MAPPKVTSVKFTRKVAGDPKFNQNEWVVEVANDQDNPASGEELMAIAVRTATAQTYPAKAAPRKAPELAPVEPTLGENPNSVVALKKKRYNLEAVPIGKRPKATKLLEDNKAIYNEKLDLWESEVVIEPLAKFLVE